MRKCLFLLSILPVFVFGQGSYNMTLLANEDIPNLPMRSGAEYNDVWGYRYPSGAELAIIGGMEDIFFYDVSAPANPVLVFTQHVNNLNGNTNGSLWRDFKTFKNFAYASADEGDSGLIIFNLGTSPTSISKIYQSNQFWNRAHNIYIDIPSKRLYAAGPNTQSTGLIILGLDSITGIPSLLRSLSLTSLGGGYVHDVHVRDTVAYCSHGSLHKLNMYSVNNVNNIFPIASVENYQEAGYNHSSWVNADATFMVMADETQGSDLKLVDISPMEDISNDDINTFFSELLGPSVPGASLAHNPFILGDLAYIAYYHDGVQVFDISDPLDIVRVAWLDTYPDNVDYLGYEGCWGVYPYLPSGIILASDQTYGLYVLEITNQSLDIDFLSFEAVRENEDVRLHWSVADASFGNKFEINRSDDGGKTFHPIGIVKLDENEFNYSFLDENVLSQQRYLYRIDFVEFDGNHIVSPIRSIIPSNATSSIKVINPAHHSLIIDILTPIENVEFRIFNMDGKEVWSKEMAEPKARIELNISTLIPGQYVLTVTWSGGAENMMIQKW